MWKRKPSGLTAQFGALLALAGAASVLLFSCLYFGGGALLNQYFEDSGFQARLTEKRVRDLQNYVSENGLSARDASALTRWTKKAAVDPAGNLSLQRPVVQLLSAGGMGGERGSAFLRLEFLL